MKEFFFELFSEEIPAKMQKLAAEELKLRFTQQVENLVEFSDLETFVTPRRLVLLCKISDKTKMSKTLVKGPRTSIDNSILEKFLQSNGIKIEDCFKDVVDSKEYYFFNKVTEAEDITLYVTDIIYQIITKFKWPKDMFWNDSKIRWVRPLRNIYVSLDGEFIPVNIIGISNNDFIQPHRVLGKPFKPKNFLDYKESLLKNGVILSSQERKNFIQEQIANIEKSNNNIKVIVNEALLDEIVGLTEYPCVVLGEIPERFLSLPEKIIINCMAHHQKFMPVYNSDGLDKFFVLVCNNKCFDNAIIGAQKVLNARLNDAEFFLINDKQKTLDSKIQVLNNTVFYDKLGSIYDRVSRMQTVAEIVCKFFDVERLFIQRAILLSKCDLMTEVVSEFPELQGYMGAYYAKLAKEDGIVVDGIREQYMPSNSEDELPKTIPGTIVALVDKLELLLSFFHIGIRLKGSKDSLGLRRAGIGLAKILMNCKAGICIKELAKEACDRLRYSDDLAEYFIKFIIDRLVQIFKCPFNILNAIISASERFDIADIRGKLDILLPYANDPDILGAYKRLINIVNTKKNIAINELLFNNEFEKKLFKQLLLLAEIDDIEEYMKTVKEIVPTLYDFFDNVLVNVESEQIRDNRIALLSFSIMLYEKYIKFYLLF